VERELELHVATDPCRLPSGSPPASSLGWALSLLAVTGLPSLELPTYQLRATSHRLPS
jgi:hypothetical protein